MRPSPSSPPIISFSLGRRRNLSRRLAEHEKALGDARWEDEGSKGSSRNSSLGPRCGVWHTVVFSGALGRIILPEDWYIIFERRESKLARNSSFCKHLLFIQKASLSHSKILKMDTGQSKTRRQQALYNWCSTERISTSRGTPDSCNHHDILQVYLRFRSPTPLGAIP